MREYWETHKESIKKAAFFIVGVVVGGCGLSVLMN